MGLVLTALSALSSLSSLSLLKAEEVLLLTREQWGGTGAVTVAEALARSGRVHVVNTGGLGHRSVAWVNGASPSEVEMMVDGLPMTEAGRSALDLSEYRLEGLEKIEVTEGVSPSVPGRGSRRIGINLVTKSEMRWTGAVQGRAASYGAYEGSVEGNSPFGVSVAGSYAQSEGLAPSMRTIVRSGRMGFEYRLSEGS
jgi:vitamin B12 transporter